MKTTLFTLVFCVLGGVGLSIAADKQPDAATNAKSEKGLETNELHVSGMSCHNCSDAVEDALAALDGVEVDSVDAKRNLAFVKFDPDKVSVETLAAAVKGADKKYALEKTVSYRDLEYENDGSFSLDGKAFTGTATDKHRKSGNKSKNYQFKNGKLHGLVREWYDNGQMGAKKFYKEGKRHGKTEYWDEVGKLTATKIYKDDVHVDEDGKEVEE
ncbi:MAG: copper chaperone CopZ [Pseudoalteromonas tetraodonis]|jgi:copper chaperone CopZ